MAAEPSSHRWMRVVLPMLMAGVACSRTSSEESRDSAQADTVYLSKSLVPSLFEQQARYQKVLSGELANHLNRLDHVHSVSVLFHRPVHSPLRPARCDAPSVSVIASVIKDADAIVVRRNIIEIATTTVVGLDPDRLSVIIHVQPDPSVEPTEYPRLTSLGPFEVAADSKNALQSVVALLLGLIAALAVWAFAAEHINASLRARLRQLVATETGGTRN